MLRKALIAAAGLAAAAALAWWWIGGTPGAVRAALPAFPDYPEPARRLAADASGRIHFASATPYDLDVILGAPERALPTTGVGELTLPPFASAEDPAPAVVLLHGSGGIMAGRERETAERLADAGFAAFVVDYYSPRGIDPVHDYMLKVVAVTEFDALADAYGALRLLSTHPALDPTRIALAGFSYGGMAVRIAMDERVREALAPGTPGFAAFVDFYGPCFQDLGTRRSNGAPLLTLRGSEDASNDLAACVRREEALRAIGVEVEAHVFPGAGHAWENDEPRQLRADAPYLAGCEIAYDEAGRASVAGQALSRLPVSAPREERIAARLAQGGALGGCVRRGYVIGSDPDTREHADAVFLGFLARHLVR